MTQKERELRGELRMLQIRYDDEKMPPPVWAVVKQLEREIAWLQHQEASS